MFLMYSIVFVPSLYLHIEYYLTNHNQQVEIKEDSVTLIVADRIVSTYQASDIQKVDLFKSAALDKGGIQIMPIDSYHFARIIPKAGNEIIVTCLIASDVEAAVKELKGVPIERKKKLFSSTKIG